MQTIRRSTPLFIATSDYCSSWGYCSSYGYCSSGGYCSFCSFSFLHSPTCRFDFSTLFLKKKNQFSTISWSKIINKQTQMSDLGCLVRENSRLLVCWRFQKTSTRSSSAPDYPVFVLIILSSCSLRISLRIQSHSEHIASQVSSSVR